MTAAPLRLISPADLAVARHDPVDAATLTAAAAIMDDVRAHDVTALRAHAERLGDLAPDQPLVLTRPALEQAAATVSADDRALLERTAARIARFAAAQRATLTELTLDIDGGRAGHHVRPLATAGCYAPGGRFPLPSSVLMTAVTARVAGVPTVWVASPRPAPITCAAALVAGADALLAVGGAQAIAAFAYGAGTIPRCDVIVGPGNRWVTAAKHLVAGRVAIDMLAGPSELIVLADDTADPAVIAADLLAQAEHDPDALPVLVTPSRPLADAVNAALAAQLATLPTAATAGAALANGFIVLTPDLAAALAICEELAPEHLEVQTADADAVAARLSRYGGLFIGGGSAEVLGDYGAGPNHVLPTGGTARFVGGLSVLHFLRINTWLSVTPGPAAAPLIADAARLARLEGLEAHARAAEHRA